MTYSDINNPPPFSDLVYISNTETIQSGNGNMTYWYYDETFFSGNVHYTYQYDTKNHPESQIEPAPYMKILGYSTKNNISSALVFDHVTNVQSSYLTYTYTYNSNNFPTLLTRKSFTVGSTNPNQTTVFKYYY